MHHASAASGRQPVGREEALCSRLQLSLPGIIRSGQGCHKRKFRNRAALGVKGRADTRKNPGSKRRIAVYATSGSCKWRLPGAERKQAFEIGASVLPESGRDDGRGFTAPQAVPANRSSSTTARNRETLTAPRSSSRTITISKPV